MPASLIPLYMMKGLLFLLILPSALSLFPADAKNVSPVIAPSLVSEDVKNVSPVIAPTLVSEDVKSLSHADTRMNEETSIESTDTKASQQNEAAFTQLKDQQIQTETPLFFRAELNKDFEPFFHHPQAVSAASAMEEGDFRKALLFLDKTYSGMSIEERGALKFMRALALQAAGRNEEAFILFGDFLPDSAPSGLNVYIAWQYAFTGIQLARLDDNMDIPDSVWNALHTIPLESRYGPEAWMHLARKYMSEGDTDAACLISERVAVWSEGLAAESGARLGMARCADARARDYRKQENYREARRQFEEAASIYREVAIRWPDTGAANVAQRRLDHLKNAGISPAELNEQEFLMRAERIILRRGPRTAVNALTGMKNVMDGTGRMEIDLLLGRLAMQRRQRNAWNLFQSVYNNADENTDLKARALLGLEEVRARRSAARAIDGFITIADRWPRTSAAPEALARSGEIAWRLGRLNQAKVSFSRCLRSPVLNRPDSTLNRLDSALNRPDSTLNRPDSTLNRPDSALNRPDSSLNRSDSTLNRPDSTLNRPDSSLTMTDTHLWPQGNYLSLDQFLSEFRLSLPESENLNEKTPADPETNETGPLVPVAEEDEKTDNIPEDSTKENKEENIDDSGDTSVTENSDEKASLSESSAGKGEASSYEVLADSIEARCRFGLAWMKRIEGDFDEAIKLLKPLVQNDERAAYWYARNLEDTGNIKEASEVFSGWAKNSYSFYALVVRSRTGSGYEMDTKKNKTAHASHPDILAADTLLRMGLPSMAREMLTGMDRNSLSPADRRLASHVLHALGEIPRAIRMAPVEWDEGLPDSPLGDGLIDAVYAYPRAYSEYIESLECRNEKMPPALLYALVRAESAFNPVARSHARALGLTQVIPRTGRRMANSLGISPFRFRMLLEPCMSVKLGSEYFVWLLERYEGEIPLAIAAYNAGEQAVDRWLVRWGHLPIDTFLEEIPFRETNRYTKRVLLFDAIYRIIYEDNREQPFNIEFDQPFNQEMVARIAAEAED